MFKLKIIFRKSSSQYYISAIKFAKKFDSFIEAQSAKEFNILEIQSDEWKNKSSFFNNLWDLIRNWKGTELYIDGKTIGIDDLNQIKDVVNCSVMYEKSVIQENHCKNGNKEGWCCKHLTSIDRYSESDSYYYSKNKWFEFGTFSSENVWKIDRDRIFSLLEREAQLKQLNFCTIFNLEKTKEIVFNLPESIELKDSDIWEVKYSENIDGNILEKKPVGVKLKNNRINVTRSGLSLRISTGDLYDNEKAETLRNIPEVNYEDIGGIDGILQKIREVIEIPLLNPNIFSYLGITPHKGILLYGPPGCGKTLIAKAIAHQVNAHFISIKGPELISKWHGQSEENLRNVFEEARKLKPTIIFFDEIDSIAQRRTSEESLRIDSKFVNQLLTLLDGMEDYTNVRVIATTNRQELLDEALLRPGRFDYHIKVDKPDKDGCIKIFGIHTQKMPIEKSFDSAYFSSQLLGLTGAEISFIAREGAYNCLRRVLKNKLSIEDYDFQDIELNKLIITDEDFKKALSMVSSRNNIS